MVENAVKQVDVAGNRLVAHAVCLGEVKKARLTVASATNRPMAAREALAIGELLNVLIAADALYCQLLELACRLCEARERGNMVDFWRAVGEIERFVRERGA